MTESLKNFTSTYIQLCILKNPRPAKSQILVKMLTKNVRGCNTELLPTEVKEAFDTYLAIY